ncbi:MAG: FAD binding domain-containing protein [Clostridiales bacterium]|nr:FAD binding domain-containing protein [Clostridiales bacterium]
MIVHRAKNLKEAIDFLSKNPQAKLLAGGTDLMPRINQKLEKHSLLCYIGGVDGLRDIKKDTDGSIVIGALNCLADVCESGELNAYTALKQAASSAASPQIRNQATLGGNLMQENRCIYFNNAVFWSDVNLCFKRGGGQCFQYKNSRECVALFQSDIAPVLMAYGAAVIIEGTDGRRELPLTALYLKAGQKSLLYNEVLTDIRLPALNKGESSVYVRKTIRGSFDFPLVSCAVWLKEADGLIADSRVVFGAAGVMPSAPDTAKWQGKPAAKLRELAEETLGDIPKIIAPFKDTRVNGPVRKEMAKEVFRQAIEQLVQKDGR